MGVTNTAVTLGAYAVALRLAVPYLPAGALAYGLGAANGFVLNRAWTFRVRGRPSRYCVVAGAGLAANALLLRAAVGMSVPRELAQVAVAAPVTLVTFALSRSWAFASDVPSLRLLLGFAALVALSVAALVAYDPTDPPQTAAAATDCVAAAGSAPARRHAAARPPKPPVGSCSRSTAPAGRATASPAGPASPTPPIAPAADSGGGH